MSLKDFLVGRDTNVSEKNKWIKQKLSDLPAGTSIIDVGAGTLFWKQYCKHLEYTSQDFCQYDPNDSEVGLQDKKWKYPQIDIVSDICSIPVESNTYDTVLCTEVLEHVPDPNMALRELIRIVKPGGALILTAPFASLTHMAPYHFCSGFNIYWWEKNITDNGAEIIEMVRNGNYFSWIRQELMRLPMVAEQYMHGNRIILKIKCALFIHSIKKYLINENDSGELLCFEYMIKARKI